MKVSLVLYVGFGKRFVFKIKDCTLNCKDLFKVLYSLLSVLKSYISISNCLVGNTELYRVFHDTGRPEIYLSPRPFINMNWTPANFLSV